MRAKHAGQRVERRLARTGPADPREVAVEIECRHGQWRLHPPALTRSALGNRLAAYGQAALNRPPRPHDSALGVLFERLVLGALAAETLKDREVAFVTLVRKHLIALWEV